MSDADTATPISIQYPPFSSTTVEGDTLPVYGMSRKVKLSIGA